MPELETLLLVTLAGLTLSASPGPSMLYVFSRSLQSRQVGLMSAVGLAVGGCVHVVAAALGMAMIFTYLPPLFTVIKLLGAGYLLYLGIDILMDRGNDGQFRPERLRSLSLKRTFWQGVAVEVLNPKTLLFFVAFLPQFVDSSRGTVTGQMLILGLLVPLTAIPSDLIVAFTGGSVARRLSERRKLRRFLDWLAGLFLIGLGFRILIND